MKRLLVALLLAGCSRGTDAAADDPQTAPRTSSAPAATAAGGVTVVAANLEVPWSIVFAPDRRMLFTERPGRVRVVENGRLRAEPLLKLTDVVARGEAGLMGLALHPDFAKTRFAYLCYAVEDGGLHDVVVRYRDTGAAFVEPRTIVSGIPAARFHAGCRLKFGPDAKLYITTGDATDRELAQKLESLAGKILRVNDDGSIPTDNPFPRSPVWTLGHRNPQGIDWDPRTGAMWETEHGPSGFDGGSGGDEVNVIVKGRNYGWPIIRHHQTREGLVSPVAEYTPAVAPASAVFWRGDLYFGCLRGEHVHKLVLDPKERRTIVREERLFTNLGRIRDVAVGPDGALYFSTSNRDGRGDPATADDRILRVAPP